MESKVKIFSIVIFMACFAVLTAADDVKAPLQCYVCNSAFDKFCDTLGQQQERSVSSYLQNCTLPPNHQVGDEPLCRRTEFTTITGEHRIVRSCGWVKSSQACSHLDSFDLTETACQCFHDKCNGSSSVTVNLATILFVSLAAILSGSVWSKC